MPNNSLGALNSTIRDRSVHNGFGFLGEGRGDYAFQVVSDLEFAEEDCFSLTGPVRVPAACLLSQLV